MSKLRFLWVTCIVFSGLLGTGAFAQGQSPTTQVMQPGLWRITVQTKSPVLAAPVSHEVCIDKANAVRPSAPKSKPGDDCQSLPDAAAANETAYTVRCGKRKITTTSRFKYASTHFEGTVSIKSPDSEIQQVYTAERIGDCDVVPETAASPSAP
jgi:hypothetical protein